MIIQINLKGYGGKGRAIAVSVIGKPFYDPSQSQLSDNELQHLKSLKEEVNRI